MKSLILRQNFENIIYSGQKVSHNHAKKILGNYIKNYNNLKNIIISGKNKYVYITRLTSLTYLFDDSKKHYTAAHKGIVLEDLDDIFNLEHEECYVIDSISSATFFNNPYITTIPKYIIKKKYEEKINKANTIYNLISNAVKGHFKVIKHNVRDSLFSYDNYNDRYGINANISKLKKDMPVIRILLGDHMTTNYETGEKILTEGWFYEFNTNGRGLIGRYVNSSSAHKAGYLHSHINNSRLGVAGSYCTNGRSFITVPQEEIKFILSGNLQLNETELLNFELTTLNFLYQIIEYIKQESIAGIPYKRISSVFAKEKYSLQSQIPFPGHYSYEPFINSTNFAKFLITNFELKDFISGRLGIYNPVTTSICMHKDLMRLAYQEPKILEYFKNTDSICIREVQNVLSSATTRIISEEEERYHISYSYRYTKLSRYIDNLDAIKHIEKVPPITTGGYLSSIVGYDDDTIYITHIYNKPIYVRDHITSNYANLDLCIPVEDLSYDGEINEQINTTELNKLINEQENTISKVNEELCEES